MTPLRGEFATSTRPLFSTLAFPSIASLVVTVASPGLDIHQVGEAVKGVLSGTHHYPSLKSINVTAIAEDSECMVYESDNPLGLDLAQMPQLEEFNVRGEVGPCGHSWHSRARHIISRQDET